MSRHARLLPLLAILVATVACKPAAQAPADAPASPTPMTGVAADPATTAPAPAADVALPPALKVGAGFPEARAALIAAGWLPLQDRAACMAKVGDRAALCYGTPELASCDAAGCTLEFAHADALRRLRLVAGAPATSDPDETPAFGAVASWTLSPVAATEAAGTCPAADFDGFLQRFAADPLIRARYTAPLVRVARMIDRGDAGDQPQDTYVAAANYTGFALRYRDGAWYPSVEGDAPRPAPLDVRVAPEAGGAYYVSVPGNVEGVSYRFERSGDCWRLAADPDAAI